MNNLFKRLQPIDLIALITITGGFILKFVGENGTVSVILTTIVVFYFGKKEIFDKIAEHNLPEAKSETVEQLIRRIAEQEVVDPDLAVRVAKCESGLNPSAINRNSSVSVDRGLYQWNNLYHPEVTDEMAFDMDKATRLFCQAVKAGNLYWWNASAKCWRI